MKTLVCYVSGHGFGHASRVMEVLRVLRAGRPDLAVDIRSPVPKWFFEFNATGPFTYTPARLDVGAVQHDSLAVDPEATLRAYAALSAERDVLLAGEQNSLAARSPALIFADIPALAVDLAGRLGIPAVAMTNFSWDWIYADYVRDFPRFAHLVDELRTSYASTALLLRLPLHGDLTAFPRIRDIPFVARLARVPRDEARQRLGLPDATRLVLLSFGGLGAALRHQPTLPPDVLLVTSQPLFPGLSTPWCRTIPTATLGSAGLRYEDLVGTADVVMTKPGYGIVAECIANGTPMVYTPRGRFAEYERLVPGIEACLPHAVLETDDLYAGRWAEALERVLALPRPNATADVGGARTAADALGEFLDRT